MSHIGLNEFGETEISRSERGEGGSDVIGPLSSAARPMVRPGTPAGLSAQLIWTICDLRRARKDFFPGGLFSDAAWDILLQLYAAHLEQHRVCIGKVTRRTGIAATTVLRWLSSLTEAGLVWRSDDPNDNRRVFVALSPGGAELMHRYFTTSGTRAIFI